jgi:hypothetical protein
VTATPITCPVCGTVSYFEELNRDASAFCRVCDFPLFWVRSARLAGPDEASGDAGLRRLPGTAGRVAVATLDCPVCTEPNPVSAEICIRCGSQLHPAPPEPAPEPTPAPPPPVVYQPPPPPPPPAKRVIWPWVLLGVLAVIAVVILVVLLAT